jgi:hypothetical protein
VCRGVRRESPFLSSVWPYAWIQAMDIGYVMRGAGMWGGDMERDGSVFDAGYYAKHIAERQILHRESIYRGCTVHQSLLEWR